MIHTYIDTKTGLTIHYEYEDNGYWGYVCELPGCASQGDTFEEFVANIRDATEVCLEVIAEAGMPNPLDSITLTRCEETP